MRLGQKFSTGHALIGKDVGAFTFRLKKTNSPTGLAYARIRDSSDMIKAELGSIDVSTIAGTQTDYKIGTGCEHAIIADGDRIALEITLDSTNRIEMTYNTGHGNSQLTRYTTSWIDEAEDLYYNAWRV